MIGLLSRAALLIVAGLVLVAVVWQTWHVIDWAYTLYEAEGDGSLASYLRWHAKTYVDYIFGQGAI